MQWNSGDERQCNGRCRSGSMAGKRCEQTFCIRFICHVSRHIFRYCREHANVSVGNSVRGMNSRNVTLLCGGRMYPSYNGVWERHDHPSEVDDLANIERPDPKEYEPNLYDVDPAERRREGRCLLNRRPILSDSSDEEESDGIPNQEDEKFFQDLYPDDQSFVVSDNEEIAEEPWTDDDLEDELKNFKECKKRSSMKRQRENLSPSKRSSPPQERPVKRRKVRDDVNSDDELLNFTAHLAVVGIRSGVAAINPFVEIVDNDFAVHGSQLYVLQRFGRYRTIGD